jgi:hypothetical protein
MHEGRKKETFVTRFTLIHESVATPFSGVSEIHKVFQWAEASEGGLILFIDEAEAFLKVKRRRR